MPPPESLNLLEDVRRAAEAISQFTAGMDFDRYLNDKLVRMAVERAFEIIGEALVRLRKSDPATAAAISHCQEIIGFRNVLIHRYFDINQQLLWDVAQTQIPILRMEMEQLL